MSVLAERASQVGGRKVASNLLFHCGKDQPAIASALTSQAPLIADVLAELENELWLAPGISVGPVGGFYRLADHHRSICFTLKELGPIALLESDVLTFKGTEPLLPDYTDYLRWMTTARLRSEGLPMLECLPLIGGAVPGGLTLFEATREQRLTTELQRRHLKCYGSLAHAPVPLALHRLSEEENQRCAGLLMKVLSPAAFERIAHVVQRGLAVLIAYYPSAPIRADAIGKTDPRSLRAVTPLEPAEIIDGWLTVFARMLYLGFMPFASWGTGRGSCLDPGNAAIDGGVTDCDSLVPLSMLSDSVQFYRAFLMSLDLLRRSVAALLGLSKQQNDSVFRYISLNYVTTAMIDVLERESRPGMALDPRIEHCLRNRSIETLSQCSQGPPLSDDPYRTVETKSNMAEAV